MPEALHLLIQNYQNAIRGLGEGYAIEYGTDIWQIQKSLPMIKKEGVIFKANELGNIIIECLKCYHTCESIGYGFSSFSEKLKSEYLNLPKDEIVKLKKDKSINMNMYLNNLYFLEIQILIV